MRGCQTGAGPHRHAPAAALDISFDLLAIGNWNGDTDGDSIELDLGGAKVWEATFSTNTDNPQSYPAANSVGLSGASYSGVLSGGTPFTVFPVTVPIQHVSSGLQGVIRSRGISGLENQGFGIDNIQFSFGLVPPQAFDIAVPTTVSDGVPGAGAGNLEIKASEDRYRFEVAAGQSLYLDWLTCPSTYYASWSLVNATTGATVTTGHCSDRQITNLSAGSYVLSVKPRDERTGTYSLNIA